MGIFCIPLICSCVGTMNVILFQEPEKIPSKNSSFDFDMNQSLALDIDYGFKGRIYGF